MSPLRFLLVAVAAVRAALRPRHRGATARASRLARSLQIAFALGSVAVLGACADLPTGPGTGRLDRGSVAAMLPAVVDARMRLAVSIADISARQAMIIHLADLEAAMRQGNAADARDYLSAATVVLTEYRKAATASSGADLSALTLTLDAVTREVIQPSLQP